MFFENYPQHADKQLNKALLWEYDPQKVDYDRMRNIVVQRVIERGWPNDWYFILNHYGLDNVKSTIKDISYLNDKDMSFVSEVFGIPLTEMKCYEQKRSTARHWNS